MNPSPEIRTVAVGAAEPRLLMAAQATMFARAQQLALGWLTESEQARLATMQHPHRRQEFVACRYALRSLLASVTGQPVEHWRLDASDGSAPRLNAQHHGAHAAATTHLTLSHSGSYLACAVAAQPVGVDIEVENFRSSRRDALALATLACSEHEMQQLRATGCALSRHRMFMQWWTLKESYFKCLGTGVDFSHIQRIECRLATDSAERPLAHGSSWSGKTTTRDQDVVLSVCALEPGARPFALLGNEVIEWYAQSDWVLMPC